MTHLLALLLAEIANERLKILVQDSTGHGPRHVTHVLALLLAEITNERLKFLTSLLVDL